MKDTIFTEFFRKAGFRVLSSSSSDWVEMQKGFLLSIPYHQLINPSDEELDDLLERSGAFGARFPTSVDNYGFDSNLQFCRTVGYSLEHLKRQAKQQVKKGEANFTIQELSPEILQSDELELLKKTCARQHRHDPKENTEYWSKLCMAAKTTPGAHVLGAMGAKGLASFLFILETSAVVEFIIQCSDSDMLALGPNNLLTFYATKRYLADSNPPLPVCYGLGSLEETPSLDRYKVGMGFTLEPIKQRIYMRRNVCWLLNRHTVSILEMISKLGLTKNYYLSKSIGMINRYLSQH